MRQPRIPVAGRGDRSRRHRLRQAAPRSSICMPMTRRPAGRRTTGEHLRAHHRRHPRAMRRDRLSDHSARRLGFRRRIDAARGRATRMSKSLRKRGLIEWAVVDPGSVNLARFDEVAAGEPGFVYLNPGEHVIEGLRVCARHGVRPSFAIYEPGFARLGAALASADARTASPALSLHVLRSIRVRVSAVAELSRRASVAFAGGGARRALDDRRIWASIYDR